MIPHVVEARYVDGYRIWMRFDDGASGVVDLDGELEGPVFAPLRNHTAFRSFNVHPELKTLVWPNGADLAPEFLRSRIRVVA